VPLDVLAGNVDEYIRTAGAGRGATTP
jgi:hypothetical protein